MAGFFGFQNGKWDADAFLHGLLGQFTFFTNTEFDKQQTKKHNQAIKDYIKANYPWMSDTQIEQMVAQYGDTSDAQWWQSISTGKDSTNWDALKSELEKLQKAYDELGEMPDMLSPEDLSRIQQEAYAEIDTENQRLLDLYNQTLQNSENALNRELVNNAQMFGDYRNQILTNNAMQQQAIAGSTRFELDRQQRNAIIRGASAAQRLVANINTQLGLQAQSAQQSLDTSNALAQNLLAHRQAQQDVRNAYLNAQNQYNQNVASTISGQAERKYNYGQGRKQGAVEDNEYGQSIWNDKVDRYFHGDSFGADLYRNTYGTKKSNAI